jgi:hypothetical protein
MAAAIPEIEPSSFFCGDTVTWKIYNSDYLASTYTVGYSLVNTTKIITLTSAAYETDWHLITISSTTSAAYTAGTYDWISYFQKTGERWNRGSGQMVLKTNYATQSSGYDARSTVQKIFEALEATILGKATKDQLKIKVGDREITKLSPNQLLYWRNFYADEYHKEIGTGGRPMLIKTTFTRF